MNGWIIILIGIVLLIIPPIGAFTIVVGIFKLRNPGPKNAPDPGFLQEAKGYQYVHSYDNTGIAYDPSTRRVKLLNMFNRKLVTRDYDLQQLRGYESKRLSGGQILGTGAQAAGTGIRIDHENRMGSGVFINVKDVDYPKWRIAFHRKDTALQNRWEEILNQAFE